jgi:hypothetical protein
MAKFQYLVTTETNQNCIHEEVKEMQGFFCHHAVQKHLSYNLLSKMLVLKF